MHQSPIASAAFIRHRLDGWTLDAVRMSRGLDTAITPWIPYKNRDVVASLQRTDAECGCRDWSNRHSTLAT